MSAFLAALIGLFIGAFLGILFMSLVYLGRREEEAMDREVQETQAPWLNDGDEPQNRNNR